jgi:low affinity Fe/Cu permease
VGIVLTLIVVVVWLASGSTFHYPDTWQLVINTGTMIVTFLMVPHPEHTKPGCQGDSSKTR